MSVYPSGTAAAEGLASCHVCCKLAPASLHACPRCGAALHLRKTDSLQRTIALVVTASILYIPANVLPIMTTTQLGRAEGSTILGGVVLLMSLTSMGALALVGEGWAELSPFVGFAVAALFLGSLPAWGGVVTTAAARRRVRRRPHQYTTGDRELHLGPDGLYSSWEGGDGELVWSRISQVVHHRASTFSQ